MPYLFDDDAGALAALPPARVVLGFAPGRALSHAEYFALALSCHLLTCATPVPTDVDNAIRLKLWPEGLPLATALEMGALVRRVPRLGLHAAQRARLHGRTGQRMGRRAAARPLR